MSKQVSEITNLSTAAHDLLQGIAGLNDVQRARVFRTVKGILERVDNLVGSINVCAEIKALNSVTLTMVEVAGMNIAALQLPGGLVKALIACGVRTIGDLGNLRQSMLRKSSDIGEGGADIIIRALERFNVSLEE